MRMKLLAAFVAVILAAPAAAQNAGTVTNHAFAVGKGAGKTGYTSLLCASAQLAVGQSAADPICQTLTGDVTITAGGVTAIGASKVTNAQLNTMAANTTKCNATGGTANPTDCTASTMKTNLGLVIGTNVEAWDADLDCFAALSSTGVMSRTGAGTCSAGALALSGLATGTQDTIVGYFGSTTASAVAMNNCTGALTYSTTTHTFGCNAAAGTGTVTNVATAGLATGGPITTTGTVTVTAAVQSDQETGSSNAVAVTPGVQKFHPSAAKVWAIWPGAGGAATASFNVSGNVVRNSVGNYTITFATSFSTAIYACIVSGTYSSGNVGIPLVSSQATGSITVLFRNSADSASLDPGSGHVVCYGDQ